MQTVHVRVIDGGTNKPTPVRIRFTDASGQYHAPLGRLADFPTGPGEEVGGQVRVSGRPWAYIDGACEVRLPPGQITVEVSKGVEYTSVFREVQLAAGQLALRLTIDRWIDPRPVGWHAGDVRAHELPPHATLLEGAGEGLAVVQLLARERPGALRNLLAFSGTEAALRSSECQVAVNTLNEHAVLGTVGLLDSHRPVYPLRFGEPGPDDWSVADWCDQCHRKRGLVVWPDLPRLSDEHPQGEALAALALGKIDAYEVTDFPDPEPEVLGHYYRLLDAGMRPTLVGGSGKESNAIPLGAVRTYAQLLPGEVVGPAAWAKAVRGGRTFITNGPIVTLSVEGAGPGQRVRLTAEATSAVPFESLELLAGSELIACKPASGSRLSARLETDFTPSHSTWVAARCHSPERLETGSCIYAHTSPVWIDVPGRPMPVQRETIEPLLHTLSVTRRWVESQARCGNDQQRQRLLGVLDGGRDVLLKRLS
jgi:hypothetical protein